MIKETINEIVRSPPFAEFAFRIPLLRSGEVISLRRVAGSLLAIAVSSIAKAEGLQILLVSCDQERATRLRDDCALILGEKKVGYFGGQSAHMLVSTDSSTSVAQNEILMALQGGRNLLVIASPQTLVSRVPAPSKFRSRIIDLHVGGELRFSDLSARLREIGFSQKDFTENYGDFAVRGGILDVYPYLGENPIRCEFWDDTIQSIREFEVRSQRSICELTSAHIVPSTVRNTLSEQTQDFRDCSASILDYFKKNTIIVLDEYELIQREFEEVDQSSVGWLQSSGEVISRLHLFPLVESTSFARPSHVYRPGERRESLVIDFGSAPQPAFNGDVSALVTEIGNMISNGFTITLASDTADESRRLQELVNEALDAHPSGTRSAMPTGIETPSAERNIKYITETLHSGFVLPHQHFALLTEHEIFSRLRRRGSTRPQRIKGLSRKQVQELRYGDYVVHVEHGIGLFAGLAKIKVGGIDQEVLKLQFLGEDVLYVNLNFIHRVQKYSSQEGHVPRLTKLGSGEWERLRDRSKKGIKDIARELITLYANRKHSNGFAFSTDTYWQKEMEASFIYEDTPDQQSATSDVKHDMEDPSPMDRLICGDVGFGKTEIAVRASFKTVMDGKQVAVLVPTTILALQHYNTFQDRLSRYSVRVENISRLKTSADQKKVIELARRGAIDILIGTHRLLSKDVEFKDLGLLIIDEEHRFGVSAKEKLRHMKSGVDTLSLTATPIPRTLHFSLIGARDISIINTPPPNRIPIITEVIVDDARGGQWTVIREAILRELDRGGQIYFVHDRVNDINMIANKIASHVPQARVEVAHGQMNSRTLEYAMVDFLERKYDILVCTKIIESGLDLPNVNTILINRADRFGLAELYQLRGRVGRSNIQAYAYLLTPPLSTVPKAAFHRLQAIEEFAELGSGFRLAMRDLEIRGAGNLLGPEQSGFILEMGFDMYERTLREAVDELQREEYPLIERGKQFNVKDYSETVVDVDIEAYIRNTYIESDTERLEVYRRLYSISGKVELHSLREELEDRFGKCPEEVDNLLTLIDLRLAASEIGIVKLSLRGEFLILTFPESGNQRFYGQSEGASSPFQRLMKLVAERGKAGIRVKQDGTKLALHIPLSRDGSIKKQLERVWSQIELMKSSVFLPT